MLYSSAHKQAKSSYHSSHMRQNVHVPNLSETCSHVSKPTMTVRQKNTNKGVTISLNNNWVLGHV